MRGLILALLVGTVPLAAHAQPLAIVERNGAQVSIEPYAPGIVRVTIATDRGQAKAAPGYGIVGKADPAGWRHRIDASGDVFASAGLTVTVAAQPWPKPPSQMERYFAPSLPPVSIDLALPDGATLTRMTGWEMAPHDVAGEHTFKVGAGFTDTPDTHYYGLGQYQDGVLDLRGRTIDCRHDYDRPAGEAVCVPFMVTDKGYAILWDNPSATIVSPGLHNATHFQSNVGERVSFFVVTGNTTDELYAGYARLTGRTPLPPKAAFGLIQSKARYETQAELTGIADGYRKRGLPLDIMVLDWFYWTRMGQLDIDRTAFPDPAAMNAHLRSMGMRSIVSVWPRFEKESRWFDMLAAKGWLLKDKDGKPVDGLAIRSDRAGGLIDSTNPDARAWYWGQIRDNIFRQGFDYAWLDETEPDLVPDGYFYAIGSGDRYHNVFPLLHTASVADGSARDRPDVRNMILCRAAYLGAQANGCLFWSSDVQSTWDALKRQVPTGLGMTASGIAYWSSDTGGWQWPNGPAAAHPVLVDPTGATAMASSYRDYPELFVRWFEYNAFTPTLRIHGQRAGTALWDYGAAAKPILADVLRLRYGLIPYFYVLGHATWETGAPFMRALFMDFPNDATAKTLGDEYMVGPAFLVAPVTEQGATERRVWLPAGTDWYDWWTDKRYAGGQWIVAPAPISRIPLFVRAGSIVPIGAPVPSTATAQPLERIRVFPGRDAHFTLYDDDGTTNAYRKGGGRTATLLWDDRTRPARLGLAREKVGRDRRAVVERQRQPLPPGTAYVESWCRDHRQRDPPCGKRHAIGDLRARVTGRERGRGGGIGDHRRATRGEARDPLPAHPAAVDRAARIGRDREARRRQRRANRQRRQEGRERGHDVARRLLPAGIADMRLRHHSSPFAARDLLVPAAQRGIFGEIPTCCRSPTCGGRGVPPAGGGSVLRHRRVESVQVRHRVDPVKDQLVIGIAAIGRDRRRDAVRSGRQRVPFAQHARPASIRQRVGVRVDQLGFAAAGELPITREQRADRRPFARAELLHRPAHRERLHRRLGHRVRVPCHREEEGGGIFHRLQVADVDDPQPVRAVLPGEVHLLPHARHRIGVEPLVVAGVADIIEMVIDAVPARAAIARRGQPPDIAPIVVRKQQRHVVRDAHPLVVIILHLLVERPDLRRLGGGAAGRLGDDPPLVGDDAFEKRDRGPLGHRHVAVAAHADRHRILGCSASGDPRAPERAQPLGVRRIIPGASALALPFDVRTLHRLVMRRAEDDAHRPGQWCRGGIVLPQGFAPHRRPQEIGL